MKGDEIAEKMRRGGTDEWRQRGSAIEHRRYAVPVEPKSRRRCRCGCKRRATHRGMANGVALTSGCELSVARWVRNPLAAAIRGRAINAAMDAEGEG